LHEKYIKKSITLKLDMLPRIGTLMLNSTLITPLSSQNLSCMSSRYLFHFAQTHNEFRLPELASIAELYGISYTLLKEACDATRPFMVIELKEEKHARLLAKRCTLIK